MGRLIALAAIIFALCAAPAAAKEGLYAEAFLSYSFINGSGQDPFDQEYFDSLDPGPGVGLRLGAGFNKYLALEGSFFNSYHNTDFLGLSGLERQKFTGKELALKINFPLEDSRLAPYLFAGFGAYKIGDSGGAYYKGSGVEFGGGMELYLEPEVSINAGLTYRSITFTKGTFHLDSDVDADTTTLDVGIAFHFL